MIVAIGLALSLLIYTSPSAVDLPSLRGAAAPVADDGEKLVLVISSANNQSAPTPVRREQMTEPFSDEKEDKDLDCFASLASPGEGTRLPASPHECRLHTALRHDGYVHQLYSGVKLRC